MCWFIIREVGEITANNAIKSWSRQLLGNFQRSDNELLCLILFCSKAISSRRLSIPAQTESLGSQSHYSKISLHLTPKSPSKHTDAAY